MTKVDLRGSYGELQMIPKVLESREDRGRGITEDRELTPNSTKTNERLKKNHAESTLVYLIISCAYGVNESDPRHSLHGVDVWP